MELISKMITDKNLNDLFDRMSNPPIIEYKQPKTPHLEVGWRVNHSRFGDGLITEVTKEKVMVKFDSGLTKELLSKFAKLEILTKE